MGRDARWVMASRRVGSVVSTGEGETSARCQSGKRLNRVQARCMDMTCRPIKGPVTGDPGTRCGNSRLTEHRHDPGIIVGVNSGHTHAPKRVRSWSVV